GRKRARNAKQGYCFAFRAPAPKESPMPWPSAVDYRDALQQPGRVFELAELRACRVETNHLGVPRPRSGASAQVYKFMNGPNTTAVRVFLYPSEQREERYQALHDHLSRLRTSC